MASVFRRSALAVLASGACLLALSCRHRAADLPAQIAATRVLTPVVARRPAPTVHWLPQAGSVLSQCDQAPLVAGTEASFFHVFEFNGRLAVGHEAFDGGQNFAPAVGHFAENGELLWAKSWPTRNGDGLDVQWLASNAQGDVAVLLRFIDDHPSVDIGLLHVASFERGDAVLLYSATGEPLRQLWVDAGKPNQPDRLWLMNDRSLLVKSSGSGPDALTKYDARGKLLWTLSDPHFRTASVSAAGSGRVALLDSYDGCGPLKALSQDGKLLWQKPICRLSWYSGVIMADDDSVYLAGLVTEPTDFGLGPFQPVGELRNPKDLVIARYVSPGKPQWVRHLVGQWPRIQELKLGAAGDLQLLVSAGPGPLELDGAALVPEANGLVWLKVDAQGRARAQVVARSASVGGIDRYHHFLETSAQHALVLVNHLDGDELAGEHITSPWPDPPKPLCIPQSSHAPRRRCSLIRVSTP